MSPRLKARLRSWFARSGLEREMREEMEAHLEQATELLMARGLSQEEAKRQAAREFGPVGRIQEEGRDARGAVWIESTRADIRYALRQFRRRPVTAITIMLVLGLGLGVNNSVFAVVHSIATQPPIGITRDPSIVRIRFDWHHARTYEEVAEFALLDGVFSEVVFSTLVYGTSMRPAGEEDGRVQVVGTFVTPNFFEMLGVRPAIGRFIGEGDSGQQGSIPAVLGYHAWQTYFGGDPEILGREVQVNNAFVTVVGVAGVGFGGIDRDGAYELPLMWLPLSAATAFERVDEGSWSVVGRLAPGVSRAAADAAVKAAWARTEAAATRFDASLPVKMPDVAPLLGFNQSQSYNDDVIYGSAFAVGASLLFLLVVCTNVSALMVGVAATRRREIAVRLSLGASRRRLIRQLVTESVLLALAGATVAFLFLIVALRVVRLYMPGLDITPSWEVVAFTFALALGTGALTGLSPALHATRVSVQDALKDAAAAVSHTRSRLQSWLISAQVALTQPLLVGLGATVLVAVAELDRHGSSSVAESIVTVRLAAPAMSSSREERDAEALAFRAEVERAQERLLGLPAVADAVLNLPVGMSLHQPTIHPADQVPGSWGDAPLSVDGATGIAPGWLRLFDVPLIAGRDFDRTDPKRDVDAVIIGSTLAKQLWGTSDPIGRRLVANNGINRTEVTWTVIGVVDEKVARQATGWDAKVFLQSPLAAWSGLTIRTTGPADLTLPAIRQAIAEGAPNMSISSMTVLAAERAADRRAILTLSGATGAGGVLALLLSAIGLYALVSLTVAERKRDIGLRGALGAGPVAIIRPYVSRAVQLALVGMAVGLPISLVGARVLNAYADQEVIHLPAVTALVGLSVLVVVGAATLIPASRAVRMNPADTLRDAV